MKREMNLVFTESTSRANSVKELSTSSILHNYTKMCRSQNNLQNWNIFLKEANHVKQKQDILGWRRRRTSLKRIILGWQRLLWFIISLATFSSILWPRSIYFMATSCLVSLWRMSLATPKFPDPISLTTSYFSITFPFNAGWWMINYLESGERMKGTKERTAPSLSRLSSSYHSFLFSLSYKTLTSFNQIYPLLFFLIIKRQIRITFLVSFCL